MSKHAYISLIRFEWKCFTGHRILQVIIYILLLSAISVSMTQPLIFKTFIDNIQNTVSLHQHIYKFLVLSFKVCKYSFYSILSFHSFSISLSSF